MSAIDSRVAIYKVTLKKSNKHDSSNSKNIESISRQAKWSATVRKFQSNCMLMAQPWNQMYIVVLAVVFAAVVPLLSCRSWVAQVALKGRQISNDSKARKLTSWSSPVDLLLYSLYWDTNNKLSISTCYIYDLKFKTFLNKTTKWSLKTVSIKMVEE